MKMIVCTTSTLTYFDFIIKYLFKEKIEKSFSSTSICHFNYTLDFVETASKENTSQKLVHIQKLEEELGGKYCVESVNGSITFKSSCVNDLWFENVFIFIF